jgi:hypothetical protein
MKKNNLSDTELIEYYLGKDQFKDQYFSTSTFPAAYGEISTENITIEKLKSEWVTTLNRWYPDIKFNFNNLGYRDDRDYSVEEFKNKKLIICFGCTDTVGRQLVKEKTWTHILSQKFTEYEVLNLGIIGASRDTISRILIQLTQVLGDEIKYACILWPHLNRREFVSKEFTKIITSHDRLDLPFEEYWDFIDWKSNNYNHFKNYHLIKNLCTVHDITLLDLELNRFDKKVPFDYLGKYFALGENSHVAIANYYEKLINGKPSLFEKIKNDNT